MAFKSFRKLVERHPSNKPYACGPTHYLSSIFFLVPACALFCFPWLLECLFCTHAVLGPGLSDNSRKKCCLQYLFNSNIDRLGKCIILMQNCKVQG